MCYGGCDCQRCNPPDEPQVTQSAWTTEKPKKEGWYWWKHGGAVTPRYVHCVTQANPPILRVECPDGWFEDVNVAGGEWQPVEPWKD